MRYYEKGHTYNGVKFPKTVVMTEFEHVVRMIIAWLILIFLAGIFIGGPIMVVVCMYWDYLAMQAIK